MRESAGTSLVCAVLASVILQLLLAHDDPFSKLSLVTVVSPSPGMSKCAC
jgi:hypothetical protein